MSPLRQLVGLRRLVLSSSGDGCVSTLASLKRLTALEIKHSSTSNSNLISIMGLLQLTALSRLAQLSVAGDFARAVHEPDCQCECCAANPGTPSYVSLTNKVTSQARHAFAQVRDLIQQSKWSDCTEYNLHKCTQLLLGDPAWHCGFAPHNTHQPWVCQPGIDCCSADCMYASGKLPADMPEYDGCCRCLTSQSTSCYSASRTAHVSAVC